MRTTRWMLVGCMAVLASAVSFGAPDQVTGSGQDRSWCEDARGDRDGETFCEVRELTGPKPAELDVADNPNGSILIVAASRRDVGVRARVATWAETEAAARALAKDVAVTFEGGRLRASGPQTERRTSWSVSYRIEVPASIDMTLATANGAIDVSGVTGRIRATTSNGSVRLAELGGQVSATTRNGSLRIVLDGSTWNGTGLEATTSNGSVRIDVPDAYDARLVAGTSHGSLRADVPVEVQGRFRRQVDTTLGKGGPTIRIQSSNGSVDIRRR